MSTSPSTSLARTGGFTARDGGLARLEREAGVDPRSEAAVEHVGSGVAIASKHPHDPAGEGVSVVVVGHHDGVGADPEPGGVHFEHLRRGQRDRHVGQPVGEVVTPVGKHRAGDVTLAVGLEVGAVARLVVGHLAAYVQDPYLVEMVAQPLRSDEDVRLHGSAC